MPLDFLPAGKYLQSFSEGNEALEIDLPDELAEAVAEKDINDLTYPVDIFICMPVS